jgi:glycosyltransferase involved in cell wall biosynthesis
LAGVALSRSASSTVVPARRRPTPLLEKSERTPSEAVSVVLGTYNRDGLLQHAINSVRAQREGLVGEIIVVDGGSTDGSLEWLLAQKDLITIVQHNRGEAGGQPLPRRSWGYFMNLAFRAARGRYICMISDDCFLLPGCLAAGIDTAEAAARCGKRVGGVAFYFRNWPAEEQYYVQQTLGARLMVNHGLFSKEALEAVDYADDVGFQFYKADGDLSIRIWEAGFEIIDAPNAVVEHYLDDTEKTRLENNETLRTDQIAYSERWGYLSGSPRRLVSDFQDADGHAEMAFASMHSRRQR